MSCYFKIFFAKVGYWVKIGIVCEKNIELFKM